MLLSGLTLYGQIEVQDSIKKSIDLDEVVVSVNKSEEIKRHVASQILVVTSKQIQFDNPQTSADIMANTGQILVQKSQQGGGSPIVRGFESNRILLVVDGVRMNNLIYRGGHLQNIITLDPSIIDRVELFFGPSSTVYGSDALGGVIHFVTKKPRLDLENKKMLSINAMQRFTSVNSGQSTSLNFNCGFKKFASLSSITYNKFGDLMMGKSKNIFSDSLYGMRYTYVQNRIGNDTIVNNENKFLQTPSGYDQMDLMQKFLIKSNPNSEHLLNFQYSNSNNIRRYDRLTDVNSKQKPVYSEWYYGPQTRYLAAYDLSLKQKLGFDRIHLGLSRQKIQESRVTRKFEDSNLNTRMEDVTVLGYTIDALKKRKRAEIRIGFDGQYNSLKSTAFTISTLSSIQKPLDSRYPNGNNILSHNAIYFTHLLNIPSKRMTVNIGGRVGISRLKSDIKDNSFFNLPVTSVAQNNITKSAYSGIIYNPLKNLKLSYLISTGYRVPNIDDLSKVFETSRGNVIVPNAHLKPEKTLTNELGISYKPKKTIRIESAIWHTFFNDFITSGVGMLNGKDSVMYDGEMSKVYMNQNAGKAILYGFTMSVNANLSDRSQLYGNISYTRGIVTSGVNNMPLDHIPPLIANLGYSYSTSKLTAEGIVLYNGKKEAKYYAQNGEDNAQYAPHDGLPAWMNITLRLSYKLPKNIRIQGGVENILDTQYRVFASGINAPGRNFYLTLRYSY